MPIYEYKCQECGEVAEFLFHSFANGKTLSCPKCGSHNLDRLLSIPSLLKGEATAPGTTCCGRTERCETPPCSNGDVCQRR